MNIKRIQYEREFFSLQKLSDTYVLSNINDYKLLLGKLIDNGIIPSTNSNKLILERGTSKLTVDDDGVYEFSCSYYDYLIWDDYGLYFKGEHGNKNKLKSNMEIMALKEFINS